MAHAIALSITQRQLIFTAVDHSGVNNTPVETRHSILEKLKTKTDPSKWILFTTQQLEDIGTALLLYVDIEQCIVGHVIKVGSDVRHDMVLGIFELIRLCTGKSPMAGR